MTNIIFIRHAPTKPDKTQHSTKWLLDDNSQHLCQRLAEKIQHYEIAKIYTSHEAKAQLTAQLIAEKLGIEKIESVANLHETERHSKAFYDNQDDFRNAVKVAMQSPDKLLFGDETFNAAMNRFSGQVVQLANQHPDETIAMVTHGRVLAMFLGTIMKQSPIAIWERLQMPAYALLSWETKKIIEIAYSIEVT